MHGHPLQPKRCGFTLHTPDDNNLYVDEDTTMNLCVYDLDEPNDDIREVLHPEFNRHWANISEGIFEPNLPIGDGGVEDARKWCISIGMKDLTTRDGDFPRRPFKYH